MTTCLTCRFFDEIQGAENPGVRFGVCHRYPPVPLRRESLERLDEVREIAKVIDLLSYWPLVTDSQWCGEYQDIPPAVPLGQLELPHA